MRMTHLKSWSASCSSSGNRGTSCFHASGSAASPSCKHAAQRISAHLAAALQPLHDHYISTKLCCDTRPSASAVCTSCSACCPCKRPTPSAVCTSRSACCPCKHPTSCGSLQCSSRAQGAASRTEMPPSRQSQLSHSQPAAAVCSAASPQQPTARQRRARASSCPRWPQCSSARTPRSCERWLRSRGH